ncbi:Cytochrome P450 CYP82J17 [Linum perenne]
MDFTSIVFLLSGTLLFLHFLTYLIPTRTHKNKLPRIPEPPNALPFVGHLHLLRGKDMLARKLGAFADKHGPTFVIRLGSYPTVVVSDVESMKDCFVKNDRVLAARPPSTQGKILGKNFALFGYASYGDYWRKVKKLIITELMSLPRIKAMRHVQVSEVDVLVSDLHSMCLVGPDGCAEVAISGWLQNSVLNIITRMVAGRKYFENLANNIGAVDMGGKAIGELIREFMALNASLVFSDLIPALGWIDIKGTKKSMKRVSKELDVIIDGWIVEHKVKKTKSGDTVVLEDFIDVMLSVIDDNFDPSATHDKETIIKSTAMALIIAADTTSVTLTWMLATLLNNRRTLTLLQQEMDMNVGKDRIVQDSDLKSLTYLDAVIKETFRLHTSGPISAPRVATEDITIRGYHVPKGTRVLANFWKLHKNPEMFPEPEEFRPERFHDKEVEVDIYGRDFEFLPFGTGRRACPGMNFGMEVVQLTAARLIQAFDFRTPFDLPVDMTEADSTSLAKEKPLEVLIRPRLSPQLYTTTIYGSN